MDHANQFETPTTYRLHRAEYVVGFLVSTGLLIAHAGDVNWVHAAVLFLYIDVLGYIPGAIAYRRSPDHRIHRGYYMAYNTMHSLVTQSAVVGLWIWLAGPEWALLAIPFHLFGDRGIFGNFLKPFGLPFEPEPNAEFQRLIANLRPVTSDGVADRPASSEQRVPRDPSHA
ncbi:hypothetical protein FB563_3377 [Streptomyces puniciscabiei]|uniref:Integral membrane protein n=1 Tax=Streptomyces puniciscabiei TaxID=164348 RepID=A0A542UGZ4_9ACTN|nr:hypothetical protein [Streptomyces puniciscabiei]TQK98355.1 hypothetical protein FB563_3377 [Streptomyces puniciscabiei]